MLLLNGDTDFFVGNRATLANQFLPDSDEDTPIRSLFTVSEVLQSINSSIDNVRMSFPFGSWLRLCVSISLSKWIQSGTIVYRETILVKLFH